MSLFPSSLLSPFFRATPAGAVFPGGRPVDAIDRIDAIDEVGRRVQCTMQNAQCTMGEGAVRRRAGGGLVAEAADGDNLYAVGARIGHVGPGEGEEKVRFTEGDLSFSPVVGATQAKCEDLRNFGAKICGNQMDESAAIQWIHSCCSFTTTPLFPSGILSFFQKSQVNRMHIKENQQYTRLTVEFEAPGVAAWRPAEPEPIAAAPLLSLSA